MKIVDFEQGSSEWLAHRARRWNASEVGAALGIHPTIKRDDLLRARYDGSEKEIGSFLQRIFDKGHEIEAMALPMAEKIIGDELYKCSVEDDEGWMAASLDGHTDTFDIIWECKSWNQEKVAHIEENNCPPEHDFYQCQQQLMITGAKRCLYMVTDRTEKKTRTCWVEPDPIAFKKIVQAWKQVEEDLKNYEPQEQVVEAVGAKPETLPALYIEVEANVISSNLYVYRDYAIEVFENISTDLETDQDFADAEQAVKWCGDVEKQLKDAKKRALEQAEDIDALFKAVDDITETARQKRLTLDKLVKGRKAEVRADIARQARQKLSEVLSEANGRLGYDIIKVDVDFAEAMKSKRTIESLREACDSVLTQARLEIADHESLAQANLKAKNSLVDDDRLFPDLTDLVLKDNEDFMAIVKTRVAEEKEREEAIIQKRLDAEKEAAAKDEEEKLESDRMKDLMFPEQPTENEQDKPVPDRMNEPTNAGPEGGRVMTTNTRNVLLVARFGVVIEEDRDLEVVRASLERRLRDAGFNSLSTVEVSGS